MTIIMNKFVVASIVAFVMLAVAATTMVTQEAYARTWIDPCDPGYHITKEGCVPDTAK